MPNLKATFKVVYEVPEWSRKLNDEHHAILKQYLEWFMDEINAKFVQSRTNVSIEGST